MKTESFNYLQCFVSPKKDVGALTNWFYPVTNTEILKAEERLGFNFPSQLKNFYQKIGYGSLKVPYNIPLNYIFHGANYINPPSIIADIMIMGQESGDISQEALDMMQPGDMPFFHIGDSCLFLVMRPQSENPNAVYNQWGDLVEKSFDRFIWRLYYEDPSFYETPLKLAKEL